MLLTEDLQQARGSTLLSHAALPPFPVALGVDIIATV